MTIKTLPGFPESQNCVEYTVGAAQKEFIYPAIQQCISLTGFNIGGLLGTHISPGSSAEDVEQLLNALRSGGGANYPDWYIVGQFQEHFKYTKVKWTSIEKIVKTLRMKLSKTANFYAFDTSPIVSKNRWNWGVDIKANRAPFGVNFSYAKSGGAKTKPFKPITDDFLSL